MKKDINQRPDLPADQDPETILRELFLEILCGSNSTARGREPSEAKAVIGSFGSLGNPIPVNGPIGERNYLAKLRGQTGYSVMFHRKGSNFSSAVSTPVDTFEVVCLDGTQWTQLTLWPYHQSQSSHVPDGFSFTSRDPNMEGEDLDCFGTTCFLPNFPHSLPQTIRLELPTDYGERLASVVENALLRHSFERGGG